MNNAPPGVRGRLANLLTDDSYRIAMGVLPTGKWAWIGMRTIVANSVNWSDWYWYDDPTTPQSSITFKPSGSNIGGSAADCGFIKQGSTGFFNDGLTGNHGYLCEYTCGKYTAVACYAAITITLRNNS